MRRFVPVGDKKLNVLEAAPHARSEAGRIVREIEALRPSLLLLDRSKLEWSRIGHLDPFEQLLYDTVASGEDHEPDAVWNGIRYAMRGTGIRIGLLRTDYVPPPKGSKGMGGLRKAVQRQGFERSGDPIRDRANFVRHYVNRLPLMWQWMADRREHAAKVLAGGISDQPTRVAVVLAAPDADDVVQRVVQLRRPR